MPRTTAPSTNPRILSGYAPYTKPRNTSTPTTPEFRASGSATTEERRQLLLDDPHARDVHPEQVTCTRCSKTVRLQKGKKYHLAHWLDHRWRCDNVAVEPAPRAKCRTLPERKAILEADADAKVVEPDRVVCRKCDKEVKLRKGRPYGLSSWTQHKMTCQPTTPSPAPSASSPSPTPSERHTALKSDPLVAALDTSRVKCALCLAWIDLALQTDMDVHAWRRHRAACIAENFADDKLGRTRSRFFRPRHRLTSGSGSEDLDTPARNSPEAEDHPIAQDSPSRAGSTAHDSPKSHVQESRTSPHVAAPSIRISSSRSPTPPSSPSPPPLSYSAATSATTSAAPTPLHSPRHVRTHSLFPPCSRRLPFPQHDKHAPFPEYTPLSLSRFAFDSGQDHDDVRKACDRDNVHRKANDQDSLHYKVGAGALGLHLSPRSASPTPPPYPERTALSLPIPERYWRFESIE